MPADRDRNPRLRYLARLVTGPDFEYNFRNYWLPIKHWRLPSSQEELRDGDSMRAAAARALVFSHEAITGSPGAGRYLVDVVCIAVDTSIGFVAGPVFRYSVEARMVVEYSAKEIGCNVG